MNLRDLSYLVAIADHHHFGKAAEACFVSQPALSMQIKKLEETLGITLLERTNKSVTLTQQGELIATQARQILRQVKELQDVAKAAQDPLSGEFKIGIFPTLAPYLLPLIIPALNKMFPKLSFYLLEEQTAFLLEKLKTEKIDAALLAMPINESQLDHAILFTEEFLLATKKSHPLAKAKIIQTKDLDQQTLLLLDEGHCLRDQALSFCHKIRANEAQHFRATSLETLRHMVAGGIGMTLMPKLACHPHASLRYIPFNTPKPSRTVGLYWRASSARQIAIHEIAKVIKKIMN